MHSGSQKTIYAAIGANVLICISKFIAAFFTGSSAMLAEGIHSVIDTGNDLLLLLGIKRSAQPADKEHPFGYGREIYFWAFVVSILIFALGGGFALYEGIHSIKNPSPIQDPAWNYGVLIAAILFEGTSLSVAIKAFKKNHKTGSLLSNIIKSKDPSNFAVILEDSAAVAGLLIALVGISLSILLQNPYYDGGASMLIGALLLSVATFLARESKALLLGETAGQHVFDTINEVLDGNKNVKSHKFPKTLHLGPESILVVVELDFVDGLDLLSTEKAIKSIRNEIIKNCPKVSHVFMQKSDVEAHK